MPIFEVILNGKSHKMEFSGTPLVSVLLKLVVHEKIVNKRTVLPILGEAVFFTDVVK